MLNFIVLIMAVQILILWRKINNLAKWSETNSGFIYTIAKILEKEGLGREEDES